MVFNAGVYSDVYEPFYFIAMKFIRSDCPRRRYLFYSPDRLRIVQILSTVLVAVICAFDLE